MITSIQILPQSAVSPLEGIKFATYKVEQVIGLVTFIIGTISAIVSIWNAITLISFRAKNSISD